MLISILEFQGRFFTSIRSLGAHRTAALCPHFATLEAAYNEPHRAYHTWDHIADALALLDEHQERAPADARLSELEAHELTIALFYHDAIYDPRAGDNEEQSAALCNAHLEAVGVPEPQRLRIARLIMGTKHLGRVDAERPGKEHVEAVLHDIDLGILGTPAPRYRRYVRQVRREYHHLSDRAFHEGRLRVVEHFLSSAPLYQTSYFFERLESQAHRNLSAEHVALKSERV